MSKKVLYRVTVFGVDLIFLLFLYLNTKNILNYVLETNDITIPFAIAISTVFIKSLGYILLGNYQMLWMYTNKGNFVRLCINYIVTSISCLILWFISSKFNFIDLQSQALLICLLIEFCYLTVSRFALAYYFDNVYSVGDRSKLPTKRKRTLIVGAGSAGCMVFKEICAKKEYGYNVLGFLDDSDDKIGSMINGIKVYDKVDEVCQYVDKLNIEEVIIAIPSASKHRIQSVINKVVKSNANVQIIPDKSMLLTSNISDSMRKVSIDDLLGREQVVLDIEGINDFINNKVILVTGGGGSIGSEICRQVLKYNPKKLVVFDIYENSIYDLQMELNQIYKSENRKINYEMVIGSVRDKNRLEEIFKEYKPNIVFHAAAHKHVPLMEVSPKESFKNNVMGTYNVGFCADKYKIEKMVLISTDKAVNPTNVMGVSKRICEMVMESWNKESKQTAYSMVRFGNVLGSNGSVIPLFEKQIAKGGPITLTDERITRFFMTIPEACSLVIQSGVFANGGEKFILDMGSPIKIIDLAKNMIKLAGLREGIDIDIEVVGLRPGEKLYEELLLDTNKSAKTRNDKIFVETSSNVYSIKEINKIIDDFLNLKVKVNKDYIHLLDEIEILKKERKTIVNSEVHAMA